MIVGNRYFNNPVYLLTVIEILRINELFRQQFLNRQPEGTQGKNKGRKKQRHVQNFYHRQLLPAFSQSEI
jgi:hypothetical protein